ncbi:MAG: hypothetical protein ACYCVL_05495, partial [Gemmatimonadaceae bacterium]
MLLALRPHVAAFVFTNAPTAPESRAWDLDEVAAFARDSGLPGSAEPDFDAALRAAEQRGATVLVTGSFHTVGDAMSRLHLSPFPQ